MFEECKVITHNLSIAKKLASTLTEKLGCFQEPRISSKALCTHVHFRLLGLGIRVMVGESPKMHEALNNFRNNIKTNNYIDMIVIKKVMNEIWYHTTESNSEYTDANSWLYNDFLNNKICGKVQCTCWEYLLDCINCIPDCHDVWSDNYEPLFTDIKKQRGEQSFWSDAKDKYPEFYNWFKIVLFTKRDRYVERRVVQEGESTPKKLNANQYGKEFVISSMSNQKLFLSSDSYSNSGTDCESEEKKKIRQSMLSEYKNMPDIVKKTKQQSPSLICKGLMYSPEKSGQRKGERC